MYKTRNAIRITAIILGITLAALLYVVLNRSGATWETPVIYVLSALALMLAIFYFIRMRYFRKRLNQYFKEKGGAVIEYTRSQFKGQIE